MWLRVAAGALASLFLGGPFFHPAATAATGDLEPELVIDCRSLPNVEKQDVPGTCTEYGILDVIDGIAIIYNTNVLPAGKGPRNWTDFWDVKRFRGPRALERWNAWLAK